MAPKLPQAFHLVFQQPWVVQLEDTLVPTTCQLPYTLISAVSH